MLEYNAAARCLSVDVLLSVVPLTFKFPPFPEESHHQATGCKADSNRVDSFVGPSQSALQSIGKP